MAHPPFSVGPGVRALSGFVTSTNPATDLVLDLFRVGTPDVLLIHADGGFQPEGFRYAPAGGVPPGDYYVKVCDFPGGGGAPEPRTYNGTITIDDTPAPPAYWAKWETFPAHPNPGPFGTTGSQTDPWGRPATDIRETWCWRGTSNPACDRVVGNLPHGLRGITTSSPTSRRSRRWATTRRPRRTGRTRALPLPPRFSPTSPVRDYTYPLDGYVEPGGLHGRRPDGGTRRLARRLGGGHEPVRGATTGCTTGPTGSGSTSGAGTDRSATSG